MATGRLQIIVYTSDARLPLEGATVRVMGGDGELLALRLTDRNGRVGPISLDTSQASNSQSPNQSRPFRTVTLEAQYPGYERIRIQGVQIFGDTMTIQTLELIPLALYPEKFDPVEEIDLPQQNL